MAADPRQPRGLPADEVAERVRAVLAEAERDAREIVAAARREVQGVQPPAAAGVERDAYPAGGDASASSAGVQATISQLADALESVAARVEELEARIDARIDILWQALSAERTASGAAATATVFQRPSAAAGAPLPGGTPPVRTERVRAVDLALRGYTRKEISTALQSSLSAGEIEQLLDEILERA